MKAIIISSLFIMHFSFCFAQNDGRLILKGFKLKPGHENVFEYHPIPNLSLPDKIAASILYKNKGTFHNKIIEAKKTRNNYQFSFKVPDATSVLIIGLVDNRQNLANFSPVLAIKKTVIDNNNGSGFIYYSDIRTNKQQALSKILLADLLENKAEYFLDIISSTTYLLQLYEEAYRLNPTLKKENSYVDYLSVLYDLKKDSVKSQLLAYANQIQKTTKDEIRWRNATRIYSWLKMEDEVKKTNTNILSAFPNGEFAKEQYWDNLYKSKDYNEMSILSLMKDYIQRFNDSTAASKDKFYYQLVTPLLADGNWKSLFHYENLIDNKFGINYSYNKQALKLCGEELDSTRTNLGIAKIISKRAVDFAQGKLREAEQSNEWLDESQGLYNRYVNTYALILYKLRLFDSAYYYQNIIYQQNNALNTTGFERYAAYAEKAKGIHFAKQVVEALLIKGISSKTLEKQLASIYKQLNISPDEFTKLQKTSDSLFWKNNEVSIKVKYGSTKASAFSLSNISNESVSLSSLTNKVIVLDFWANWCGPCKASFPMMKRLLEKYKNDNEVVFLFIDVWEGGAPQINLEKTKQFMTENNYAFNVLFDVKNVVVKDYKIKGIPTKFVINKKGEIIFVDDGNAMLSDEEVIKNISFFIEAAKN
jgi:thiol-disulfide isomerase/thioredoxin